MMCSIFECCIITGFHEYYKKYFSKCYVIFHKKNHGKMVKHFIFVGKRPIIFELSEIIDLINETTNRYLSVATVQNIIIEKPI